MERGELLHEVAARLRARTDELARVMTLEGGKPLIENSDEVGWTAAAFDYYAEMGRNFAGRVIPPIESSQLALVVKEPIGAWGCIVPWNYPLLLLSWKLAPALAAGNTVVAKPSELTPLSTLMLADCFDHLPPGVVNLLAGAGDVGSAIVDDAAHRGRGVHGLGRDRQEGRGRVRHARGADEPRDGRQGPVHRVRRRGRRRGRGGARRRLGGVPERGPGVHLGRALLRGARGLRRLRVRVRGLHALAARRRSARGATDVGPMVSAPQRAKVEAQVEAAVAAGAEVARGRRPRGLRARALLRPAVVTGAPDCDRRCCARRPSARWRRSCPCDSLDEAIGLANGTRFGLGANVYTRDLETAVRCMREIRAGTVWINDPLTDNDAGPFGGLKQSGLGRELGQEGLEAFQETKHVHIETKIGLKDWWYPYGA